MLICDGHLTTRDTQHRFKITAWNYDLLWLFDPGLLTMPFKIDGSSITTLHLINVIYSLAVRAVNKRADEVGNLDTLVRTL